MKFTVIFFASFCIPFAAPTAVINAVPAIPVKSINIPYRSPVYVTGYAPATTAFESALLKSYSYATRIRHEVPVAQPHVVAVAAVPAAPLKSIALAPAGGPVKSSGVVIAAVPAVVPVEVAAVPAEGPLKSSAIKSFSFATKVRHEVPVVAAPIISEPAVKSIHAPVLAVKSINAQVLAPGVVGAVAPVAAIPAVVHAEGPVKSSAIETFSFATKVRHDVPLVQAPLVSAPIISAAAVKSIHSPVVAPLAKSIHAPAAIAPVTKSIHAPAAIAPITIHAPAAIAPVTKSIHAPAAIAPFTIHAPAAIAPVTKSIHAPAVVHRPIAHAPAFVRPVAKSIDAPVTKSRYGFPSVVRAPVLSAAGLMGSSYYHPGLLARRLPLGARFNRGIYGRRIYESYPRLYASLAAPGSVLWRGHPVSSGVTYLAGISRGAFGYQPVPVHYQGYSNPIHGVWNFFRG